MQPRVKGMHEGKRVHVFVLDPVSNVRCARAAMFVVRSPSLRGPQDFAVLLETDSSGDATRFDALLLRRERRLKLTSRERKTLTDVVNSIAMWLWASMNPTAPALREGSVS